MAYVGTGQPTNLTFGVADELAVTAREMAQTIKGTQDYLANNPYVAAVDLTAQAASISSTTLWTPTTARLIRVSYYAKVTRAATSTSTLGSLVIGWTDPDGVAQTFTISGASGNTTTTVLQGSVPVMSEAAGNVTYTMSYASSGATTMQYNLHLRAEQI